MFILAFLVSVALVEVWGHGRLVQPPGRATMWRMGYDKAAINYNDNQLFCGGFERQYTINGGKCGICGDPWDETEPREHEDGGLYGQGIITGRYHRGESPLIDVEITAHHKGYFEFKACPINHLNQVANQECLDRHPLPLADGSGTKYYLPLGSKAGLFPVRVILPSDLSCSRCVLQWHYYTGNRWGNCGNGTSGVGCGTQETFRGCADISISDGSATKDDGGALGAQGPAGYDLEERKAKEKGHSSRTPESVTTGRPAIEEVVEESNKGCGGGRMLHNKDGTTDHQKVERPIRETRLGKYP